jgi:hypothetical protein
MAIAGALGSAVVATTAVGASFIDPTGDVILEPQGAAVTGLDITNVDVTNAGENLTFRVTFAGAPPLLPNSIVVFSLDTDKNASTDEGVDAQVYFQVDSKGMQTLFVGRYDSTARDFRYFEMSPPPTYADGTLVLKTGRFFVNNARGFRYFVLALVGDSDRPTMFALDGAPDDGATTYDLVGLPPLLEFQRPIGEPTRPRAGERFTVTSTVLREETADIVRRGKVTCVARVGKRQVRATGRFTGAGAQCAMTVPRGTRGKTLRGSIKVQTVGANGIRTFAYRIT